MMIHMCHCGRKLLRLPDYPLPVSNSFIQPLVIRNRAEFSSALYQHQPWIDCKDAGNQRLRTYSSALWDVVETIHALF